MFTGKQRPKGLEFASCQACNNGTRHADLIASLLGRLFPNPTTAVEKGEIRKLMQAVGNNVPGVLKEMTIGPAGEVTARRISEGGIVWVDGPLITEHMGVFAAKLGFSTHFEAFGSPVPPEGGVLPFWFSNIQAMKGEIPEGFTKYIPELKTLQQGKMEAGEQFRYAWTVTDER